VIVKRCPCCFLEKDVTAFGKNKSKKDGLATECKECKRSMDRNYAARHREEARKKASDWYYANLERAKANRKIISKKWQQENPDKNCAKAAKYRSKKLQATPSWLTPEDYKQIEVEYSLAQWASEVMKEEFHVDHIVPLQGKNVCGLHVPWNLQVIPAVANLKKGNKNVL
jgi:hypothetical protein